MAGKILVGYHFRETCGGENIPDGRPLIIAVLDHQKASRHQVRRAVLHDPADIGQAIVSGD